MLLVKLASAVASVSAAAPAYASVAAPVAAAASASPESGGAAWLPRAATSFAGSGSAWLGSAPWESLISLGTSLGQIFPENSTVCHILKEIGTIFSPLVSISCSRIQSFSDVQAR